jgi:anaerobic dimethyl sulfoxide reductase subunit C (anchor subunit)
MKKRALVVFTLLAQTAVGTLWSLAAMHFLAAGLDPTPGYLVVAGLMVLAMAASLLHLGSPLLAWRALWNVRSSWLSREIWCTVLYSAASGLYAGLLWFDRGSPLVRTVTLGTAAVCGLVLLLSMSWAYRLRTVPAWDSWATPASFLVTALLLGGLTAGLLVEVFSGAGLPAPARQWLAVSTIVLLCLEFLSLPLWLVRLAGRAGAGARALHRVVGERRALFQGRLVLMIAAVVLVGLWLTSLVPWGPFVWLPTCLVVLASEVLGRVLFYAAYTREGI